MANNLLSVDNIKSRIYTIRDVEAMLDSDLAELYEVEIRVLNQAVKRNIECFPANFIKIVTRIPATLVVGGIAILHLEKFSSFFGKNHWTTRKVFSSITTGHWTGPCEAYK